MGCISSKMLIKSNSFQEEVNLTSAERDTGLTALEDPFSSNEEGDHMLSSAYQKLDSTQEVQKNQTLTISAVSVSNNHETRIQELTTRLEEEEEEEEEIERDVKCEINKDRMISEPTVDSTTVMTNNWAPKKMREIKLYTLKIPETFNFPTTGNLRDGTEMGEQDSPGCYATPRFGNSSIIACSN